MELFIYYKIKYMSDKTQTKDLEEMSNDRRLSDDEELKKIEAILDGE